MTSEIRTPILLGESGATFVLVQQSVGAAWIEKAGCSEELATEAEVLRWVAGRLPVATILEQTPGVLRMSVLPVAPLMKIAAELAGDILAQAFNHVHAVPIDNCPFTAEWDLRLGQARRRMEKGLVDPSDFDEENLGRSAQDILEELEADPPLPPLRCFTHGDACLENFLADGLCLTGIVDLGAAGVTHPAQDWALALRSMRGHFGDEGAELFRPLIPEGCDAFLLRRFQLLDEFF